MVFGAFFKGIREACRHWRGLLLFWLAGLLLAGGAALSAGEALESTLPRTESAAEMAEGWDWLWHREFSEQVDPASPAASIAPWQVGALQFMRTFESYATGGLRTDVPIWLFWLGIAYMLTSTFLTGGMLGLFSEEESRFTLRFFFDRAGRYFPALLGILVAAQLLYWILWGPVGGLLEGWYGAVRGDATTEWTPTLVMWAGALLLTAGGFFVHMWSDYARAAAAAWDRMGLVPTLFGSFGFVRRNLGGVLGLFYITVLLGAAVVFLYGLIYGWVESTSGPGLFLTFALSQLFILTLVWLRMVFLAGQTAFYRSVMGMPALASPPGPVPPESERPLSEEADLAE
ncbi:MAG: hypothetical protein R6W82_10780 [bacterium]